MKGKLLKGIAVLGLIGGLGISASAQPYSASNVPPNMGPGMGPKYGIGMRALNPADYEKVKKFYQETRELRQKIWETKEALRELYLAPNPDWKIIGEKRQELVRLKTELQQKAFDAGVPFPMSGSRGGKGMAMDCPCPGR